MSRLGGAAVMAALTVMTVALAACDSTTSTPPASAGPASPGPVSPTAVATVASSPAPVEPAFAEVDCPDDVTVVMVVVPACGYLTVPESRDRSDGRTVRVFVIRIDPVEGSPPPDAMVVTGETLGGRIDYGAIVPLANRSGRVVYIVDRRGTGFSEPELSCPEIAAATPATLGQTTADPAAIDPVIAAVTACRERLEGAGVDLSAFDVDESARDIEDLRVALGRAPWNVIGFGSASRLALEVARLAPEGVRSVVMDSPFLPQGPDPVFNVDAGASAVGELVQRCADEPACHERYPDVATTLDLAARTLDQGPATVVVDTANGPVSVLVDGTRFARAVRTIMAENGGKSIQSVLPSSTAAIEGRLTESDQVVRRLARDDALCLGYVPQCDQVVHGSLLSTVCPDAVPFVDHAALVASAARVPGLGAAFASNPYFAACDAWGVPPDPDVAEPMTSSIPVLAMTGQFDPFTGPSSSTEAGFTGLDRATYLEIPNQSYNIMGYDQCPRDIRRGWLDDPGAPLKTACIADMPVIRALPDDAPP